MQPDVVGVVIAADAIPFVHREDMMQWLSRPHSTSIPLLVADLSPATSSVALREWSRGRVDDVQACGNGNLSRNAFVHIDRVEGITAQLSNQDLPLFPAHQSCLQTSVGAPLRTIMEVVDGSNRFPIFVRDVSAGESVSFVAQRTAAILPSGNSVSYLPAAFSQWAAPYFMYLAAAAGDKAWHFTGQYANLTVDDAWLVEPYGHLSYTGLLAEMEKHNFHTTVAFIPWNFDRSRPNVVSIIRAHPENFSISIHGDDHNHAEFSLSPASEKFSESKRREDTFKVRQALARMNEFSRLTGIPYDRVWIFPYSIGPEPVLGILKENGLLATVNSRIVPQRLVPPGDPLFQFRNVTLSYANFPSIRRFGAAESLPSSFLAIQSFLGNPILLYFHQDFFASGIGTFDSYADEINRMNPHTVWTSLGEIIRHTYLVKRRDDGQYDVRSYSSDILLSNPDSQTRTFNVEKEESAHPALDSVLIDGQPLPYKENRGLITLAVVIPGGESRHVQIKYEIPQNAEHIDLSKFDLQSSLLRHISDFRDLILSRSRFGTQLTGFYYRGLDPEATGGKGRLYSLVAVLAVLILGLGFGYPIWRKRRSRQNAHNSKGS
jgi:peptidoglycan/xylan/chitin deacetylase (PgdA/CDA1 family)